MNARPGRWSDNRNQRQRTNEPPLPPHLSPRRAASGSRVPRQQRQQVFAGGGGGGGGGSYGPPSTGGRGGGGGQPGSRARKVKTALLTLAVALITTSIGTYLWADGKVQRMVDLNAVSGRPAAGQGTNYLIVGSDSRQGLTAAQEKALHTGASAGRRTDSMMVLHVGSNGNTLLSLPRDSYVTIPAFTGQSGKKYPATTHKLNTAYSWGGATLLTQTIEYNTGLHIDHYAEIGFNGFVNLVNALGGVNMCLPTAIKDKASGADFKAGCQTLDGAQSLAFVRQRHQMATQDLGRMQNQQKFLSSIAHQAASPSTIVNPFTLYPVIGSGLDTLTVDKNMSLWDISSMFFAMKGVSGGSGKSMTVPIATANLQTPADGVAVQWDTTKAKQLFDQLKNDQQVA
jgi:LCP family protein required for cell wall assembly